jgi:sialidase-1
MEQKVLAQRGHGGYRQYRIPAMAVTPSGRIITIYDARFDFDDLPAPVDLVIRTSDDNGSTWSEQKIFREHHGVAGFGDASILVDPSFGKLGRIIVFYQYTQLAGFFESTVGTDVTDPLVAQICISKSDDDGESWSHGYITDQLKSENTLGIFATSGMGGRITHGQHQGRLLQTFVLRESELFSRIGFSDDHGETWHLGAKIPGGNETAITSLHDGSILFHSRGTPFRLAGRSLDGGLTLSELAPDQELPDPSDNGSLTTLSNGELICTHNHDSHLRMNTVIKKSQDGGNSWSKALVLEKGSSAYSTACELKDGSIAVLFERNAYVELVFCKFNVDEFRDTKVLLESAKERNQIEFTIVPRFILPARRKSEMLNEREFPLIPEVDMSGWRASERKEIGSAEGSASGDPLLTVEDFEELLGEISPGLHEGDEIRVSGRLENRTSELLLAVEISDQSGEVITKSEVIGPGEQLCFLDYRQVVTRADLLRGHVLVGLQWSSAGVVQEFKASMISTTDGKPIVNS